jgi:hypothetical protein
MTLADWPAARMGNDRARDVVAGIEGERCKRAQFSPSKRLVTLTAKFCLNRPILAMPIESE